MSFPGEDFLTQLALRLVDKTIKEVRYLHHFDDHIQNFAFENNSLVAKRNEVQKYIEDAQKNENQVEDDVQNWIKEADEVIQVNTRIKLTWSYGWCPYWQYRQGKRLVKRIQAIKDHMEKCNFDRVARPAEVPGIKYYASKDFMDFESRRTKSNQLMEALKDGNNYMIGLQGMGGTGKTTLATQVGKHLEESKAYDKVIFVVVSNPPDINKIRGDIARPLGLDLDQRVEVDHSKILWSRLSKNEGRLLIILDDVWEELSLTSIGIPSGPDYKNCYVLITTRHSKVCHAMRCQQIVHLHTLDEEDALKLFLFHVRSDGDDSLARDFVKECGGLPITIVALASTLKNWPVGEWNAVLTTLQDSKPFVDVDEDLVKVYNCLKLSYDNLNNEKAQKLLILCSIFPEDYEFPMNLIIRLGIGSGIYEEVDEYYAARTQALQLKNKLIDSSLLLKVEEKECIKMHDLVREVAQWIAKEDTQVIIDSRATLKANKRFVFWNDDNFPDQFDAAELEILLLWISGNGVMNDPEAFFVGMSRLKILFLLGEDVKKIPSPSLSRSLLSLMNIHTLILDGWKIGDVSILINLQSLVTLEFKNCLIFELPREIMKLKKLRWLGLMKCEIQKNNPFEAIEKCPHLEELYFVGNGNVMDWKSGDDKEIQDEIVQYVPPSALRIFSIACDGFKRFGADDNGLKNCFNPELIKHLISAAMFRYLVGKAEVLELGKIGQAGGRSLVPDIIPLEDGGMNNLMKLYLYERDGIEFLVDNSKYHCSNITVFPRLVELCMDGVDVEKLYSGAMPSSFLRKLQILKLKKCMELQNIFLDENLKLPYLRVLEIVDCPMFQPSIFQLSVARSLVLLEELLIGDCKELKILIACDSLEEEMIVVDSQKNYDPLFPKLKSLEIRSCDELEMVSPLFLATDLPKLKELYIRDCKELKCIFGEYRDMGQVSQQENMLPLLTDVQLYRVPSLINIFKKGEKYMPRPPQLLKEDSTEKSEKPKTSSLSQALGCCFMVLTKDANIGVSNALLEHHTIPQESCASSKMVETLHTAECFMRQPLRLQNIREITLVGCSKLKSLFSVSIASTMIMLEELYIYECEELKHIITNEEEDDEHLNCNSMLPKLQKLRVYNCNKLEFIFPSSISGGLQKLKSIQINHAYELKYVFEKYNGEECVSTQNANNEAYIYLPALESLNFFGVSNMISIGIRIYQPRCSSLQTVEAPKELMSEGARESKIQYIANVETPLTLSVGFQYVLDFCNLQQVTILTNRKLKTLFSISTCRNLPQLSKLEIYNCEELVNVVEDDCNDHRHMNYSSFFPKLEDLSISNCNKLEFIFSLTLFGTLQKLKSLRFQKAAELKYIFGKYHDRDYLSNENESDKLHIHLPALEELAFVGAPKMMNNIRTKKFQLSFPPLQRISLGDVQEFNGKSFPELMAYLQLSVKDTKDQMKSTKDVQKLTKLYLCDFKIEEVLNLEGVEIDGPVMTLSLKIIWLINLSELRHICKAPKYILSLANLEFLHISGCEKLKAIFSISIVKSLPQLSSLRIEDCDELGDIIEESEGDHLHELCFPKLGEIYIKGCNSLKCVFSISTCGMFPKLKHLEIEENSELEQVFIRKQDDMQKMAKLEEVFPNLSNVRLVKLPRLITIYEGIDFHTLKHYEVDDCPKYKETCPIQEESENGDSKNQATTSASQDFAESSKEAMKPSFEEVASSSMITEEALIEIQDEYPYTPASRKQVSEISAAKSLSRESSLANVTSSFVSQLGGSKFGSSTLTCKETENEVGKVIPASRLPSTTSLDFESSEEIEKEAVRKHAAQPSKAPTWTNLEITKSIKDTVQQGLEKNYAEDDVVTLVGSTNLDLRKQSTGPIDNLTGKDYALETSKGIDKKTTAIDTSPMETPFTRAPTVKETRDRSSVQEEAESEKPPKTILPQVIPSFHHLTESQVVDDGTSSPKLEVCEIFQFVELKQGETSLLAQALKRYPQLLLPCEHRKTHRIIAWSYRVLVDILVILSTKTPNTITPSEKSTLEANLSEAIVLGFNKDWIESVRAKVFGVDTSDVSAAKEKIQIMEVQLKEIDSQLLGLSVDRKKLIENMTVFRDIASAKDKPFGI